MRKVEHRGFYLHNRNKNVDGRLWALALRWPCHYEHNATLSQFFKAGYRWVEFRVLFHLNCLSYLGKRTHPILLFAHSWGEEKYSWFSEKALIRCETETTSSRIWTRVADSISHDTLYDKCVSTPKFVKTKMFKYTDIFLPIMKGVCLRGVMVKAMDCGIAVREFVLQSRYYVHFQANTPGKGMNPFILPAIG